MADQSTDEIHCESTEENAESRGSSETMREDSDYWLTEELIVLVLTFTFSISSILHIYLCFYCITTSFIWCTVQIKPSLNPCVWAECLPVICLTQGELWSFVKLIWLCAADLLQFLCCWPQRTSAAISICRWTGLLLMWSGDCSLICIKVTGLFLFD